MQHLNLLGISSTQAFSLTLSLLTGFLVSSPDNSWRAGALYTLHPAAIVSAVLASDSSWIDGMGDLCLAAAVLGARAGAPVGTFATWLAFAMISPVQAVCIAVPLFAATAIMTPRPFLLRNFFSPIDAFLVALAALTLSTVGGGSAFFSAANFSHYISSRCAPAAVTPGFLGPDHGLYWYLFAAVFLRALPYFVPLIWATPALLVAPALARLGWGGGEPALIIAAGGAAIFDASAAGGGVRRLVLIAALGARAKGRHSHSSSASGGASGDRGAYVVERISPARATVATCVAHFAAAAAPAMKHLWLRTGGTGNANFAMNMQLLLAISTASLLADFARAAVADVDDDGDCESRKEQEGVIKLL